MLRTNISVISSFFYFLIVSLNVFRFAGELPCRAFRSHCVCSCFTACVPPRFSMDRIVPELFHTIIEPIEDKCFFFRTGNQSTLETPLPTHYLRVEHQQFLFYSKFNTNNGTTRTNAGKQDHLAAVSTK